MDNISQLDNDVFELIWEAGRKKAIRDGQKSFSRTNEQEIESCERENPMIQRLQDVYQVYLKNPMATNKNVVSSLVKYIKNPTTQNRTNHEQIYLKSMMVS